MTASEAQIKVELDFERMRLRHYKHERDASYDMYEQYSDKCVATEAYIHSLKLKLKELRGEQCQV